MSQGHRNVGGAGMTQNQGNVLGDRPAVRQSKLFREHDSGNAMKSLMGNDNTQWDTNQSQGAYAGKPVYDHNAPNQRTQVPQQQQQQYQQPPQQQQQQYQQAPPQQQYQQQGQPQQQQYQAQPLQEQPPQMAQQQQQQPAQGAKPGRANYHNHNANFNFFTGEAN